MKTALVAGATGLVGHELVKKLVDDDRYARVVVLVRGGFDLKHPKLTIVTTNFEDLSSIGEQLKSDDVFCCLGTTMAKAKTKDNFKRVDFTYPLSLAIEAHAKGAKNFLLISAMGANRTSPFFYNKVKGETEDAVRRVPFDAVHIFRPSLLLGHRHESRPGEDAAKTFFKIVSFLIPKNYKGVDAARVAGSMIHFANTSQKGIFIHESKEIQSFS